MALPEDQLRQLLANPRESLDVELKRWLDPSTDDGKAKIAKGCLALRNSGGGLLVIGFDDKTCQPARENVPRDVRTTFHSDVIQRIVGEFASHPFAVEVQFGKRDKQEYPVISVPAGVLTPVAAKRDLSVGGKVVIEDHAVYVRSLTSNNTVSSSKPKRSDWERLVRIWFDNREADIGGFFRRQLGTLDLSALMAQLGTGTVAVARPTAVERATSLLARGRSRFDDVVKDRDLHLPKVMGFREAAIVIDGEVPEHRPTDELLRYLSVAKTRYSGWSPWLVGSGPAGHPDMPYVFEGGWEALIALLEPTPPFPGSIDFWRMEPQGSFYHLDTFHDDFHTNLGITPGTQFDYLLQIIRVVEYITAAQSFARVLGCRDADTSLACTFRWTGLKGRRLTSRSVPGGWLFRRAPAVQDQVSTSVVVPLETPPSALAPFVRQALADLFLLFGGPEFPPEIVEDGVRRTVTQRY